MLGCHDGCSKYMEALTNWSFIGQSIDPINLSFLINQKMLWDSAYHCERPKQYFIFICDLSLSV